MDILIVVGGIGVLFAMYVYLHSKDADTMYKCNSCGNETKIDDMNHYDYEYNYEYRFSKCGKIVIES